MEGLRILIANKSMTRRAGTQLYTRDLAIGLLKRGHRPVVFSTELGDVANDIRNATVPVVNNLELVAGKIDIIHGHHNIETMMALSYFPGVPAVFLCHSWAGWFGAPPIFPRIKRYLAVDYTCLDRLVSEYGIPQEKTEVILNFVDLQKFTKRTRPLPARPRRALVFSNYASDRTQLPAVREACGRLGLTLDVIGEAAGNACDRPEELLPAYDLVFAKAKAAMEAMACGAAVVLCDFAGAGEMVTAAKFERLRSFNFGVRTLGNPLTADVIEEEILRYDAADATRVSELIRSQAGQDQAIDVIVRIYGDVLADCESLDQSCSDTEGLYTSRYIQALGSQFAQLPTVHERCQVLEASARSLEERNQLLEKELHGLKRSLTLRLKNRVLSLPGMKTFARVLVNRG